MQYLTSSLSLFILFLYSSPISIPSTILAYPLSIVTGKLYTIFFSIPYSPLLNKLIDVHLPYVPNTQSLIADIAALPAEAAEDNPLALIIAAPLYYTSGIN